MFRSTLFCTLLLTLGLATTALGQTCATRCDPDQGQDQLDHFVQVDANSCKIVAGKTKFSIDTQIQLSVVHQNPFNYTYKYDIEEREIESGIINDALKLLGLLPGADGGDTPEDPTADAMNQMRAMLDGSGGAPAGAGTCSSMDSFFQGAETTARQMGRGITQQDADSRALLKAKTDALAAYNNFVKKQLPKIPKTEALCNDLCSQGEAVLPKLGSFLERKQLKQSMASLAEKIKALDVYGKGLKTTAMPQMDGLSDDDKLACGRRLQTVQGDISDNVKIFEASQDKIKADLKVLEGFDKKVKEMRTIVKSVMDSPEAFVYVDYLQARDVPVEHDVKVTRTQRESKTKQQCTATIRAGRSRFSISAGIGLSFIEQETFGRQQSIVPTTTMQDDGTTVEGTGLGEIFAVNETSSESLVGVFQLNGRITSGSKFSFGWALGATVGEGEGEASSLGYFTGPTLSLISDQLFFTLAYHQREIDSLGGDFKVGDPIPTGFMGDLPITTENKGGLLFTVTYRFR